MEAIFLSRSCSSYKFDRRGLKKVKGVPKDQLNALVDKVEISTNLRREITMNKRIIRCNVFVAILLVILCIVAASRSGEQILKPGPSSEQSEEQLGLSFVQNASYSFSHQSLKQRSEEAKRAIEKAISEYNKTSTIGDDEKTAQILLKAFNSLSRKNTLPKLLVFLICWLLTSPMILLTKIRKDRRVAFRNVCSLLNIENEMYFCKRGYLWSINHNVTKLRLIKTHDPKSFEYEEPKKGKEDAPIELLEIVPHKKMFSIDEKSHADVILDNEISEAKEPNSKPSGYPMMHYGHPFMMNQMYSPFSYYPMGFPPQGAYPPGMPMYPQYNPMMQTMPYFQQPACDGQPDFLEGPPDSQLPKIPQPGKNPNLKETSETGDESDDRDEESDSQASASKHRSFGKKRKFNPGTGSVGAKFQNAKMVK
jgi:hypothetical protein